MRKPKGFKGKYFSLTAILALTSAVTLSAKNVANEKKAEIFTTYSKGLELDELEATASVYIFDEEDIKKSKATNLYEFFNKVAGVSTFVNYGNPYQQLISFRGYSASSGYENVVIRVDGRVLNSIDLTPQLLSSIPISSIKRIEITKGSGSVVAGDGANAGVIDIVTKEQKDVFLKGMRWKYGRNKK